MPAKQLSPADQDNQNLQIRGNTWYVRYKIGGAPVVRSLDTSDVRTARKERDRILAEVKDLRAGITPPVVHSWQDAVERTLRWFEVKVAAGDLSAKAVKRYETSIVQITNALGWKLDERGEPFPIPLDSITEATLDDYVTARKEQGRSTSTLLNDTTAWAHVMRRAKAQKMIEENWMKAVDRNDIVGVRRSLIVPPSDAQAEALAAEIEDWSPEMAMLLRWLRETGMRLGEALLLRAQDIHPDGKRATISLGVKRNRDTHGPMTRTIHLGRASRFIPGLPQKGRLFAGLDTDVAVVSTRYGQWCRQRQGREIAQAEKEGRKPLTIERHRIHDLRHAFACASLVDDPKCIYLLSVHMGHTKVATTEIYSDHLRRGGAQWSYGRIPELFGSLPKEPALPPI